MKSTRTGIPRRSGGHHTSILNLKEARFRGEMIFLLVVRTFKKARISGCHSVVLVVRTGSDLNRSDMIVQ